ncbi:MAG: hypothetical protein RJB01_1538 [Actinomycetota bacterium]|jgi:hypothetical protein
MIPSDVLPWVVVHVASGALALLFGVVVIAAFVAMARKRGSVK